MVSQLRFALILHQLNHIFQTEFTGANWANMIRKGPV